MEAQAWTAIGLLGATLLGVLFYLGNRIDALGSEMRGGFQAQGSRIDTMSARMDALGSELRGGFQAQGSRMDTMSARIYEVAVKLDDHLRRHAS